MRRRPILSSFIFLAKIANKSMVTGRILPTPSHLLTRLVGSTGQARLSSICPSHRVLLMSLTRACRGLVVRLCESKYHCLRLSSTAHAIASGTVHIGGVTLRGLPTSLFVTFRSPARVLFSLRKVRTFFLSCSSRYYNGGHLL